MKGYISKLDKAKRKVKSQYGFLTDATQISRVVRQTLAKMIVGETTTIGKVNGKFVLDKETVLKKPCLPR